MRVVDQKNKQKTKVKMGTRKQKRKLCEDLAMFFAEKGKILTLKEYGECIDKPLQIRSIKRVVGSYSKAVLMMKNSQPELLKLIELKEKAELAKKQAALQVPKPAPKAAVKPAEVSAVTQDEDDE